MTITITIDFDVWEELVKRKLEIRAKTYSEIMRKALNLKPMKKEKKQ